MYNTFTPTIVTAFYRSTHPSFATVRFSADNEPGLMMTVIHRSFMIDEGSVKPYADIYDFLGNEASPSIEVEDKDVLIVVAERQGHVVGNQIFEVDLSAIHLGYLLIPRGGYNLVYSQEEQLESLELTRPMLSIHGVS